MLKARELLVLVESLIELEGEDAKVVYDDGRDGFESFIDVHAGLRKIGDKKEIHLVIV